jgi:hypothetical protein
MTFVPPRKIPKGYMKGWTALYGEGACEPPPKKKSRSAPPIKPKARLEWQEQVDLVHRIRNKGWPVIKITNEGRKSYWLGLRHKAEGLLVGICDLMVPVAKGKWHGVFIEMKRTHGSTVTDEQKNCIKMLTANGYYAVVAYGADHGWQLLTEYMSLECCNITKS